MYKNLLLILVFSGVWSVCQAQVPATEEGKSVAGEATAAVKAEEKVGQEAPTTKPADAAPNTISQASAAQADAALAKDLEQAASQDETGEKLETVRETVEEKPVSTKKKKKLIVFSSKSGRDPMLSPDDFLLLQYREQQRLAAIEAERQRKLAEERRKREEEERLRQLELARIKDPTREVRNRIKIGGIVGKEVFIGDKVYTIGNKIFGARIIDVTPDTVVFLYKGHKFVRKMQ